MGKLYKVTMTNCDPFGEEWQEANAFYDTGKQAKDAFDKLVASMENVYRKGFCFAYSDSGIAKIDVVKTGGTINIDDVSYYEPTTISDEEIVYGLKCWLGYRINEEQRMTPAETYRGLKHRMKTILTTTFDNETRKAHYVVITMNDTKITIDVDFRMHSHKIAI